MLRSILVVILGFVLVSCAVTEGPAALLNTKYATKTLSAADYKTGQIFLFRGASARFQSYLNFFPRENFIEAIEYLRKRHAVDFISSDESMHTVVFVYSGDIQPGSSLTTRHQFQRGDKLFDPYLFYYKGVQSSTLQPLVILNESHAGGGTGLLTYSLTMNQNVIIQSSIEIR